MKVVDIKHNGKNLPADSKLVPDGTVINYECTDKSTKQSGDTVKTCKDGKLEGKDLVCVPSTFCFPFFLLFMSDL